MKAAALAAIALLSSLALPAAAQAPIRIAPPSADDGASMAMSPQPPGVTTGLTPGATVQQPLVLTPELCTALAARQRSTGPSVAYQPGVDVYGRAVAPADLPSSTPPMPPITTEIQLGRVDGRATAGGRNKGYVTLQPDGSVLLDGQPLPGAQQYGLLDTCRQQRLIP